MLFLYFNKGELVFIKAAPQGVCPFTIDISSVEGYEKLRLNKTLAVVISGTTSFQTINYNNINISYEPRTGIITISNSRQSEATIVLSASVYYIPQ